MAYFLLFIFLYFLPIQLMRCMKIDGVLWGSVRKLRVVRRDVPTTVLCTRLRRAFAGMADIWMPAPGQFTQADRTEHLEIYVGTDGAVVRLLRMEACSQVNPLTEFSNARETAGKEERCAFSKSVT